MRSLLERPARIEAYKPTVNKIGETAFRPRDESVFDRHRVERAPQIPRGDASIRLPAHGEVAHRVDGGTRPIEIVDADGFLQSDVIDRQHVGAKLVEDEEHLGGPSSD